VKSDRNANVNVVVKELKVSLCSFGIMRRLLLERKSPILLDLVPVTAIFLLL